MLAKINWMTVVNTVILLFAGALIVAIVQSMGKPSVQNANNELPFYTTADPDLERAGSDLYRSLQCRNCHTIWSVKSVYQSVPAPSLDGIGSLRNEEWLYRYFSSENPQEILPSRMKEKYKMPSFASLSEKERKVLAAYFASLRVKDWYLDETISAEQKKLTGK
ncbi:MAG: hypothetical protein COW19_08265 [Zetaproteobacteria bacterium CG12_big_fil_rev_8_21_14_0_65_55_1124]|nr:MAG: hypothetical protein AUJ58_03765 [Zetaproteobacteria bacterium CG1_02_55_237]PIS20320.1 MAG: hypothetical protein COT53_00900 [Zetaproteobacteria bacterium CG08_land_8_20_14_0_20_55_17]PIW42453.1 MAG: hypothetical protein COW19_08265 [Zetaproteobacteria bacterium CG12_big_fil_rev_8_21_14_0_65_55_1124]PIY52322.1 MAG: hypothetical protein COZ01_07940 [Zetaproteobacteria bacterium CG_4_10_14_0_8_um_filter_55_43]PIZ37101.1 MAG: hypothetical protein COY36_10040 [Zetaproteobacteria bacterium 